MTTEIVPVPRDELSELLQDGVDDYWITSESDIRIVETLRALLAQPVAWELEVEGYKSVLFDNYQRALSEQEYFQGRGRTSVVHTLYRHPPAPAIPAGYALVPIQPTPEMIMAGIDNNATSWDENTDWGFPAEVANDVYRAMLAAAPKTTEGSTDE